MSPPILYRHMLYARQEVVPAAYFKLQLTVIHTREMESNKAVSVGNERRGRAHCAMRREDDRNLSNWDIVIVIDFQNC